MVLTLSLWWYVALSGGLICFTLADLVSHRTWHVALMVVALLAFVACAALSVWAIPTL